MDEMRLKGTTILMLPFIAVLTVTMCFKLVECGYLDLLYLVLLCFVWIEMLSEEDVLKLNNLHKAVLVMLFLPLVAYSSLQSSDWQGRIIIACSMIPLSSYYLYKFFKSRRSVQ
ncbi:MAG: hypothetical protein QXZ66_01660 [Thermoproteota archaeon]